MDFFVIVQYFLYFISMYYIVFLLLQLLKDEHKKVQIKKYPTVTIVIPAWNESESIKRTIETTCNLDYPKDKMKIVAIDDGSKDNTFEIMQETVKKMKNKYRNLEIKALTKKNGGKHTALNLVIKDLDTDFFCTLDADSYPEPDALKLLFRNFSSKDIGAVTPRIKIYRPTNLIERIQDFEYAANHYYKKLLSKMNSIHVTPGPLALYRSSVVRELKFFREAYKTEDMDFGMRIQKKHYNIIQENEAVVWTKCPNTLKNFYKQRHRWYYGTFQNLWHNQRNMIFNKKYGDFGMLQLPMVFISGFLSCITMYLLIRTYKLVFVNNYSSLALYDFNIFKLIANSSFNFKLLDIDLFSTSLYVFFLITSIFVIVNAFKLNGNKFCKRNIFDIFAYVFIYPFILFGVWMWVFKDIFTNKKILEWKK